MELAADARDAMGAADTADLAALARIAHGTDHLNEVAAEVGNQTHNSTSGNAPAVQRVFGDEVALADGLSDIGHLSACDCVFDQASRSR